MITFADHTMRDDVAELRRVCFDEDEQYAAFYLSNRFTSDNTLVYVEQGRAVASLTLLPATITTPIKSLPAAYVYAVATLPGFRRRGIAAALMEQAEAVLRARSGEALLLVPASDGLRDYYAKFGYRPCFYRKKIVLNGADYGDPTDETLVKPLLAADFLRLRDTAYTSGGYFVRWDEAALRYALQECEMAGGLARRLQANGEEGFFAAYPENGAVRVKESVLTKPLLPHAIHLIKHHFGCDKPMIFCQAQHTPPGDWSAGNGETEPFAMLKNLTAAAQPAAAMPYLGLALD